MKSLNFQNNMALDYQYIGLNLGSGTVVAKTFIDENFNLSIDMDWSTVGGFLVMTSIIVLNVVKICREYRAAKRERIGK